ncbi:MAG TPA: hypothetical protein VK921_08945 [Anditalea sp.]|nr:hypothetical protein [Anditalea sp.]
MGKFILIDANLISHIHDIDAITLLKPFCKKKQLKTLPGEDHSYEASSNSSLSINLLNVCTSLYSLDLDKVENTITNPQARFHPFKATALSAFFDSSSPPPQI